MQGQVATGQQDVVTGVCTRGGKGLVERDIKILLFWEKQERKTTSGTLRHGR